MNELIQNYNITETQYKKENENNKQKEKYSSEKLKINKNTISDFYDDLETKKMQRRSFLLSDEVYNQFEKVLNTYPTRIDRDVLANYLFGQVEKIFIK